MKIPAFVAALVGAVAVNAQDPNYPSNMPECGETCGDNMFAQSSNLGCSSDTDYTCLCNNPDFLYGVHDCSYQYCQNNTAANIAINWGNSFCSSNSGTITVPTETGTYSGNGTGATALTPTATTDVVETITSGSSTFETTVSSTLFGEVPLVTTTIVSTETSGGSSFTTTLATSTITSESESATPFGTSVGTSTSTSTSTSTTTESSSSTGAAPRMTVGPVAGLLAAGLAAAFL